MRVVFGADPPAENNPRPPVLVGDLNAEPGTPEIAALTTGLTDAGATAGPARPPPAPGDLPIGWWAVGRWAVGRWAVGWWGQSFGVRPAPTESRRPAAR